jgi:hypothetical protein
MVGGDERRGEWSVGAGADSGVNGRPGPRRTMRWMATRPHPVLKELAAKPRLVLQELAPSHAPSTKGVGGRGHAGRRRPAGIGRSDAPARGRRRGLPGWSTARGGWQRRLQVGVWG